MFSFTANNDVNKLTYLTLTSVTVITGHSHLITTVSEVYVNITKHIHTHTHTQSKLSKTFFSSEITKLVKRWTKCTGKGEGYAEKRQNFNFMRLSITNAF